MSDSTNAVTRAVLLTICAMATLPINAEQRVFDSGPDILRDHAVNIYFAHFVRLKLRRASA